MTAGSRTAAALTVTRWVLFSGALAVLALFTFGTQLEVVPLGTFLLLAGLGVLARLLQPRYPGSVPVPISLVFVGAGAVLLQPVLAVWLAVIVGLSGVVRGDAADRVSLSVATLVLSNGAAAASNELADTWLMGQPIVGGATPFGGPALEVGVSGALVTGLVLAATWMILRWCAHWIDQRAPVRILRRRLEGRWRRDVMLAAAAVVTALLWAIHPPAALLVLVPLALLWGRLAGATPGIGVDGLTQLASPSSLRLMLAEELARAEQFDRPLSLLVVDIDRMSELNAEHGFDVGDAVIAELGRRLRTIARDYDIVARLGPDAFAVLLPDGSPDGAGILASRIVDLISDEPVLAAGGTEVHLTVSVGVATFPGDATEREGLLAEAELAASFAGLEGGNRAQTVGKLPVGFRAPERTAHRAERAATEEEIPATEPVGPDRLVRAVGEALTDARPRTDRLLGLVLVLAVLATVLATTLVPSPLRPWTLVLFAALAVGAEWFAGSIYGRAHSSWSAVPLIALALLPGSSGATVALAGLAAGVGGGFIRGLRPRQTAFNSAVFVLSSLAGFAVARAWPGAGAPDVLIDAARGVLAGTVFFLVNTTAVAGAVALAARERVVEVWRDDLMWLVPHQLGMGAIGGVMAYAHGALSVVGVLVLVLPALGLHIAQQQFVTRTRENVVRLRRLNDDMREANQRVVRVNERLTDALEQVNSGYLVTVESLAAAVDAKDSYTGSHIDRVEAYGRRLLEVLDPELADDEALLWGFRLHDVGKIGVPDSVLTKPGPLDEDEWEMMRRHPEIGAEIVAAAPFLQGARAVILHHHERWDGRGYPYGLAERATPFSARLFAVIDAYDAMTSDRPYRAGMPVDQAVQELVRNAGSQFDPEMVEAFIQIPLDELDQARRDVDLRRRRSRTGGELIEIATPIAVATSRSEPARSP